MAGQGYAWSGPVTLKEAIAESKAKRDFAVLVAAIPYLRFLGLEAREGPNGILCVLPPDLKFVGNPLLPALHGGVVGALMESAAILQLLWASETTHVPKIIDLSVDYLRPARLAETSAQGVVTRHGRRVANVRVEAWQESPSRPVAAAHAHFLLA
jgi:uncharacterized protein (TIGR00369 family)